MTLTAMTQHSHRGRGGWLKPPEITVQEAGGLKKRHQRASGEVEGGREGGREAEGERKREREAEGKREMETERESLSSPLHVTRQELPAFGAHPVCADINLQKNQIASVPEGVFTAANFPALTALEVVCRCAVFLLHETPPAVLWHVCL